MKTRDDGLKSATIIFVRMAAYITVMILLVSIYAQQGDIQTKLDSGGQVYAEKLNALRIENTALLEENEELKDQCADMGGRINGATEVLNQITYEAILAEPEAVDLWLQIARQTLEGE